MSISFEDAVDEILTGKKKSITEASFAERIKSRINEQTNVNKILYEDEESSTKKEKPESDSGKDEKTIKKRISSKKDDNEIETDLEADKQSDKEKEAEKQAKLDHDKKKKLEYIENLKRDDVLQQEFTDAIYKTTKDPEGDEVLRVYLRINSKNVDIKRFGRAEILQFGDLDSILSKYGKSKTDLEGSNSSVDSAISAASTPTGTPTENDDKEDINSFKLVLKRISSKNNTFKIICASQTNLSSGTSSAVVSSLGMVTNFDTRQQALDYVDLQYSTLILKDIGNEEVE